MEACRLEDGGKSQTCDMLATYCRGFGLYTFSWQSCAAYLPIVDVTQHHATLEWCAFQGMAVQTPCSTPTFSSCRVSSAMRPLLGTAIRIAVRGTRFVGGGTASSA